MEFVGDFSDGRKRKVKKVDNTGIIIKKTEKDTQSSTTNEKMREEACEQIAKFFFTSGIPLKTIKNDDFLKMCDMIAQYGPGYEPPSCEELQGTLLEEVVAETKESTESLYKLQWKRTGCSILVDSWTDNTNEMTIFNFYVNNPNGTVFLKSIDASDICNSADSIFKMIDSVVDEVGEDVVVQVITKNEANFKAAGEMLMEKRKKLFWSPCAIHCIDLILQEFENKFKDHKETIANGRRITSYIYSRNSLIELLHQFTKGRDLIKPSVTKSATSYRTLRCLSRNKDALVKMFTSKKWKFSFYARTASGRDVVNLVMDSRFWNNVVVCLKAAFPLMKVLRLVASEEKPAMGFIYKEINLAKQKIQSAFDSVKKRYMPIWNIIDERWDKQLRRPLHGAAYYLNPQFHYRTDFEADLEVKSELYEYLQRMMPNKEDSPKIEAQLEDFKHARHYLGRKLAKSGLKTKTPAQWWDSYGFDYPELEGPAVRILSLTCDSSGRQRDWNHFDRVHSKRRNCVKQKALNDVIYVMSNAKLANSNNMVPRKAIEYSIDDLSSDDEWITENYSSSYDEELESVLDNMHSIVFREDVTQGGQVGDNIGGGGGCGASSYGFEIHDVVDEDEDEDEDGAYATDDDDYDDDVMDCYGEDSDDSVHFDINEFL